ncbi:MAG: GFA family protein [Proteobacteria bacterium]|nr:GFA family protein [Pseudomonadota bacterium]
MTSACHCTGCQRMTSSAFSLSSMYPLDRFEVLAGEPVIGGMHGEIRHYHCPYCLSWVFTRAELLGDLVNVRTTMLDSPPAEPPFIEIYTSEALPWALIGARHSFAQFPPMERFQPLIAEYAAHDA